MSNDRYKAFLSYSHDDERWAAWLHRRLEGFRDPDPHAANRHPLQPVFRDRSELSAGELTASIRTALEQSEALIVICSPAAARSRWVAQEIETFKQLHGMERVYPLVVEANDEHYVDSFPDPLRYRYNDSTEQIEMLAADARPGKDGRNDALLKIVAALLGVRFDRLKRRADRQRRHRQLAVTASAVVIAVGAITLSVAALIAREDAERRREQAEHLISFMLGDLSERLDTIGRLDIMDAVGDQALEYFAALESRDLTPAAIEQRGRALRQIGDVRVAQNRLDEGLALYQQSIAVLESASAAPLQLRYELALSHQGESAVHYMREAIEASLASTLAYRDLMAQVAATAPDDPRYTTELAQADNNLGVLALASGNSAAAEQHFENGLRTARGLVERYPEDAGYRSLAAGILTWLGELADRRGDQPRAIEHYQGAVAEDRAVLALDPQPHNREALAGTLTILAVGLRGTDQQASLESASEAVELLEALTQHDPDNDNWRFKHGRALTIQAATLLTMGCNDQIPQILSAVRRSAARQLEEDDGYGENQRNWIDADVLAARYALGLGNVKQAESAARAAVVRSRIAFERAPTDELSLRYFLRAVEVLIGAHVQAGDQIAAQSAAANALELVAGREIEDTRSAAITNHLDEAVRAGRFEAFDHLGCTPAAQT